jgi:hypothetical protein
LLVAGHALGALASLVSTAEVEVRNRHVEPEVASTRRGGDLRLAPFDPPHLRAGPS